MIILQNYCRRQNGPSLLYGLLHIQIAQLKPCFGIHLMTVRHLQGRRSVSCLGCQCQQEPPQDDPSQGWADHRKEGLSKKTFK